MATSWFSAFSSQADPEPPKDAPSRQDSNLSRNSGPSAIDDGSPRRFRDEGWATAQQKHEGIQRAGLVSEINRLRATMTEKFDSLMRSTEDRLRNLERLTEVQGRALKDMMGSISGQPPQQAITKSISVNSADRNPGLPLLQAALDDHKVVVYKADMRLGNLSDEVATLRSTVETTLSTLSTTLEGINSTRVSIDGPTPNMVPMDRYQQDLRTIAIDRDLVMIKASYLAIASTESTSAEKKIIYSQLLNREGRLRDSRPISDLPLPDLSDLTLSAGGSSAPRANSSQSGTSLELALANDFVVEVNHSADRKLGITVNQRDTQSLVVEQIGDGLINAWNTQNLQDAVKPGDLIVAVNDKSGRADAMSLELKQKQMLRIRIRRPIESPKLSPPLASQLRQNSHISYTLV